MKNINVEIVKDLILLIENSSFYNKIQITENMDLGISTETFYFAEEGIGHAVLVEKTNGEIETVQESHMVDKDFVYNKLSSVSEKAVLSIAGNSGEYILSLKV
ncbi:MAG: hypothetical protein K9L98_02210 [Candidatus Pacebacteria bacterium]|nr:hypothetical protein [Candidatus Paceibacterota bacterium]MCF7862800.1 hypothetical protein [Candidatus Paceibacterota bacterium]